MPDERKENMKYFDIHVTYDNAKDGAGYSIFVKANTSNEDKVLQYAIDNHLFEEDGDEKYVDYKLEEKVPYELRFYAYFSKKIGTNYQDIDKLWNARM